MRCIVVAAIALVLAACGTSGEQTLDHDALVAQIHRWAVAKEKAAPSVKVDCPDDIPIKAGTNFHCLISGGGQSVRVTVTIENDKGYVTWVVG
jgi:hypothetical protein